MLLHLSVENFILIKSLKIDFREGFSVITGETGAGKSILVGALGLILGQRADSQVLMDKGKKCIIEGLFKLEGYGLESLFEEYDIDFETISTFRREISPQGKSRAFINDTPVNLIVLKDIGERLVDIHSQNQTFELNEAAFQLSIVDSYAKNSFVLAEYSKSYSALLSVEKELNEFLERESKATTDRDYFEFQLSELIQADLKEGEQEEAESELEMLLHAEEINQQLNSALNLLHHSEVNIINQTAEVKQHILQASKYTPALEAFAGRIESSRIELKDIAAELDIFVSRINFEAERITTLQARLDLLYHLEQKHRVNSVEGLISLRKALDEKRNEIVSLSDKIESLKTAKAEIESDLTLLSASLSENRKAAVPSIEQEMLITLSALGMGAASFIIRLESLPGFTRSGTDRATFLFSANRGGELREIQKAASGGELSRLMLALKSLIISRSMLPTVLFDEIDSGVSGEIAGKIGVILRRMSKTMQVIAITHLPQIAGKADQHLLAYKEDGEQETISNLRELTKDERVNEIARLLSDEFITDSSRAAALELINLDNS